MYYHDFHGKKISSLGMGALRLPMVEGSKNTIDREKAMKVIDAAFDAGINFFDTAYTYQNGDSEKFLGEALKKYPRESYYLSSKFYARHGVSISESFELQLERLNTDYLDFYLFHSLDENYIEDYMSEENINFLLEQKEKGRIGHIGFSTHATPDVLERFLNHFDRFDMAIMQLNYVDWTLLHAKEQYEILTKHNIPVWVMEPLKGGRLATLNDKAVEILKAENPEMSVASWGFRFLMGLENVKTVMSGMSDVEQILDNAKTFDKHNPLNDKEYEVLMKAKEVFLDELGVPCSACRYCCDSCPQELNIPLLIQGYNELKVSGTLWKIPELDRVSGPDQCVGCGTCLDKCPQKIDIPSVLSDFAELLKNK
ncbi:MAG: oxidoreductase [Anaerofustis stercorihominis]|nr:oxidoreductase [Anaerofustis stercorihominis]